MSAAGVALSTLLLLFSLESAAPLKAFAPPPPSHYSATRTRPPSHSPRFCRASRLAVAPALRSTLRPQPPPPLMPSSTIPPASSERPLSERVAETVRTVLDRKRMFGKYSRDIAGKTGLGALAALAYVRNVIEQREEVWGDLLMIVMNNKPAPVEQALLDCTRQVLSAPIDPDEWVWFRNNILSTYAWFAPSSSRPGSFVYDHLLEIAREKIAEQALEVDDMAFPALAGIKSEVFLPGGQDECRQDHRLVGMFPDMREQLLGTRENARYYDLNVYLSKLVCMSQVVNPEFQSCMYNVFASLPEPPTFDSGPPKSLARCRAKAQVEYADMGWPTTAHLIDTIRCTVTFDTEEKLLEGYLQLMCAAGCPTAWGCGPGAGAVDPRLSVARVKNGFEGGRKKGYKDLKVNVVFLSERGFAMVGEVALVVGSLVRYKEATHELYEIVREEDFFRQVTKAIAASDKKGEAAG
eukprot:CAMPEP_0172064408 /NCGR_PEP_ID=MMETSP1043-20130122/10086_1 /TAXON_ID=464988 /ORGANISM="Hemiselmis andersenii, Strain CCMP441" /LENGTH=465 /DNA_ID=CAMNT_0012724447 /DNA_START=55 /DNA_END=1448 /DNA_ORIENTATION=+